MRYESTALPDAMSVDGIYTVLKADFSRAGVGVGEAHDFPEISFISRGKHYGILDGKESERVCGQLTIVAPNSFHKSARPSDSEALIISFASSSPALKDLYNRSLTLTAEQERTFRAIVADGLELFCRRAPGSEISGMILKENADEGLLLSMKKRLELFLIDLHRCFAPKDRSSDESVSHRDADFQKVCAFLKENVQKSLTVAEIARGASMSVSKLKILSREKCGGGIINLFIEIKIEKSKELIRKGELNFTEIADFLGFSSLHYFSRQFKKVMGISPSEFSKGCKAKDESTK